MTGKDLISTAGMTRSDMLVRHFPDLALDEREKIAALAFSIEIGVLREHGACLYPGISTGLAMLARRYPLYLVSNCNPDYAAVFLELFGLQSLFRDVETHGKTGLSKAENLALLMKRNRLVKPVYVGDTDIDEEACVKNEIPLIHVTYGFGRANIAAARCASFQEVVDLLLKIAH